MKLAVGAVLLVVSCALAGCATVPTARKADVCGDPCATTVCPSAFFCQVDGHCAARCQPEPIRPGMP